MTDLATLKDTSRYRKKVQRVGRGVGSKRGKTSCRGEKGDGSRQGYRRRFGYEGGQVPLYRKIPIRGFTRGRFLTPEKSFGSQFIEAHFADGDVVSPETLKERGFINRKEAKYIKILGNGELSKKVTIEAHAFSATALKKLADQGISHKIL